MFEFLSAFNWDVSPILFSQQISLGESFNFDITLRWYGMLFALGFVVGYQIMRKIFVWENKTELQLESLTYYMIIGTVAGARLGHCLFYDPITYLSDPIRILKVWEGGLASHGAAIGILLALYIYTRRNSNINYQWIVDRIVIVVALAGVFIRLGNFFNSEILGSPTGSDWGVIFSLRDNVVRHPAQLYEAVFALAIFAFLAFNYLKHKANIKPGWLFGYFLIGIFGSRFIIEFFKEVQEPFEETLPLKMGQILSIPLVAVGAYFVNKANSIKKKTK